MADKGKKAPATAPEKPEEAAEESLTAQSQSGPAVKEAIVHPLVLLSVTDHYYRVAKDTRRRVVGVLLGESSKGRVDITNSFAVPCEEDPKDPRVFFLDHDYLEHMYAMHKKISAKERIVGFYSTGPKIRPADTDIDRLFRTRAYCRSPVLVIIDVRADTQGLPTQAYVTVEETAAAGGAPATPGSRCFVHVPSSVGAFEAEEVGVEHLLRDINDPSVSHLGADLRGKLDGLRGLSSRLADVSVYLHDVLSGRLPRNNEILAHIQTALATLPNTGLPALVAAQLETANDEHLALYAASLVRAVTALHDLVGNRAEAKAREEGAEAAVAEAVAGAAAAGAALDKAAAASKK